MYNFDDVYQYMLSYEEVIMQIVELYFFYDGPVEAVSLESVRLEWPFSPFVSCFAMCPGTQQPVRSCSQDLESLFEKVVYQGL